LSDSSQFRGVSRWYWTRLLPAGWRRCAALTVSNSSLVDEVAQRLGYPRGRIHVVPYYALLPASAAPSGGVPGSRPAPPYFLTLASHEPRKNLGLAIRALASLSRPASPARLVCLGGQTPHTAELQRLAQHLGVATRISWVDYLDRAATLELLRGATALLFVSTLEGYGMPPQEAQALGAPVVLSDIPCHRAVYADPQRWQQVSAELREPPPFVATDDAEALGRLMQRLLDDPQWHARLSSAGLAYQSTFSPRSTAAALRTAFAAALES
jgi:glycosyltransferase involved in cell wall biosynthesis